MQQIPLTPRIHLSAWPENLAFKWRVTTPTMAAIRAKILLRSSLTITNPWDSVALEPNGKMESPREPSIWLFLELKLWWSTLLYIGQKLKTNHYGHWQSTMQFNYTITLPIPRAALLPLKYLERPWVTTKLHSTPILGVLLSMHFSPAFLQLVVKFKNGSQDLGVANMLVSPHCMLKMLHWFAICAQDTCLPNIMLSLMIGLKQYIPMIQCPNAGKICVSLNDSRQHLMVLHPDWELNGSLLMKSNSKRASLLPRDYTRICWQKRMLRRTWCFNLASHTLQRNVTHLFQGSLQMPPQGTPCLKQGSHWLAQGSQAACSENQVLCCNSPLLWSLDRTSHQLLLQLAEIQLAQPNTSYEPDSIAAMHIRLKQNLGDYNRLWPQAASLLTSQNAGLDSATGLQEVQTEYGLLQCPMVLLGEAKSPDMPSTRKTLTGSHAEQFWIAMDKEIECLQSKGSWEIVDCSSIPSGMKAVPGTWAHRIKRLLCGTLIHVRSHWCCRGDLSQVEGPTYSPLVR